MAATHTTRTRKTSPRPRRRRRLPRLGWWWAFLALIVFGIAKTWPIQTIAVLALTAVGLIIAARKPAWLQHAARRLPTIQRSHLPAHGHRTLTHFHNLTPAAFERAITDLALEHPAVCTATHVGQANDRGADVIAHLYDGRRILIQCKRHKDGNNVGSETIQTINGVYRDIHHCHAAVIITTANYTRAALETHARLPYGIRLIDGPALESWANGHAPAPW
ncbi:restriction endonuclease [Streptomyces pseudovenezuelae]|uniref:restriction endonuclease n=1 Tax=Streptomyces pseudovenezuelae TaxID=67350 RepID=UPI002E81B05C|nr:restriction endonuclease [Streptomyces pseudovenezuelae]WUA94459.1 restriction endonuclease [Streptomyces pseudovenezuelae]